jgi:hypothetical protein
MSDIDFAKAFPNLDDGTKWYLNEILFCLERYGKMERENAYAAILSAINLVEILEDDPQLLHTEDGFYWAMCILHGFDSQWWHDKDLWEQHKKYISERHHPPINNR